MAHQEFSPILVGELHLDPSYPRLPERLKNASEKEVLNWMLTDATLIDLMASIAENGFFSGEPILVVEENGKKIVIEGNRRLASVKLLLNPSASSVSPNSVREVAKIAQEKGNIPERLWVYVCRDRNEAMNYLAFRHVSGVKQWPLISKARYLYNLYMSKNRNDYEVYKELAREIGSKGAYVRRLLLGYQAYLRILAGNWFGIRDLSEENFDLSLISEVISTFPKIAEYQGIDPNSSTPFQNLNQDRFSQVTKWLYQITENGSTRIGDSRNLRLLNQVIQHEEALKAFSKDGKSLKEASELTDIADENIRVYLNQAQAQLVEAQKLLHKAKNPARRDLQLVDEILSSGEMIASQLKRKLRQNEFETI